MLPSRLFRFVFFFQLAGTLPFAEKPAFAQSEGPVAPAETPQDLGPPSELIGRIRQQILDILERQNGCAAWFQDADPDAAEIFRSLHYEVYGNGISYVTAARDDRGSTFFKDPWAAMVTPSTGRDGTILINRNGPFFVRDSPVIDLHHETRHSSWHRRLIVGDFSGDTDGARMIVLLHELGHVVGRIPDDDNPSDGQSTRNTEEVLRHCKKEVLSRTKRLSRSSS